MKNLDIQSSIEKGKEYFEKGDHAAALGEYDKALRITPDNKQALFEKGKTCFVMGNIGEASAILEETVKCDPSNKDARLLLVKCYSAQNRHDAAIKELETVVSESPDADMYFELGLLYEKVEDYASAVKVLEKSLENGVDNAKIHFELGRIHWVKGEGDKALKEFKQAVAKSKKGRNVHLELGPGDLSANGASQSFEEMYRAFRCGPDGKDINIDLNMLEETNADKELTAKEKNELTKIMSVEDPYLRNKAHNEWEVSRGRTVLKSKPLGMLLTLTHRCNINCFMCNIGIPVWDIAKERVEEIKTYMPYLKEIRWQGGEVFLSPYFETLFTEAEKYPRMRHSFTTNGLLLNEKWAKRLLNANVDRITFSIDGVTKDVYEKIRRGGHFETLLSNLEALNKLRKNKLGKMNILLNMVVMESNYRQLEYYPEFLKKYEFDYFQVSPIEDFKGKENIFANHDLAALTYIQEILPSVIKKAEEYGIGVYNLLPLSQNKHEEANNKEKKRAEIVEESRKKSFYVTCPGNTCL